MATSGEHQLAIDNFTVRRWRSEAGGVIRQRPVESGRYLDREDRHEIARLTEAGISVRAVADRLGRAPSTVSRELRRNVSRARGSRVDRYQPERAHQLALRRRERPRQRKLSRCPQLQEWVQHRLDEHDSPEQVAGRLRLEFGDDDVMSLSHESIYQATYVHPRGELTRQLRAHLRTGRGERRRRNTRKTRTGVIEVTPELSIHHRPEEIEGRLFPGHCEGDLIVGPLGTTAAIGTLVERTSGHLTMFHLPGERSAAATAAGLTQAVLTQRWPMLSLTWDRGVEMAHHRLFTADTGVTVYFADPHAPWQRGSNENINGLLREYFPKGTDLATYSNETIQAAADQLNNRPRKRHGYRTPNEVMAGIMENDNPPGVATLT